MPGDIHSPPGASGSHPTHDPQGIPHADPRALRAGLGLLFLGLAGLGAVLPFVPGWLFLIPAIWLLAHKSRWAARLVERFHARVRTTAPRLARRLGRLERRLDILLPGDGGLVPTIRDVEVPDTADSPEDETAPPSPL